MPADEKKGHRGWRQARRGVADTRLAGAEHGRSSAAGGAHVSVSTGGGFAMPWESFMGAVEDMLRGCLRWRWLVGDEVSGEGLGGKAHGAFLSARKRKRGPTGGSRQAAVEIQAAGDTPPCRGTSCAPAALRARALDSKDRRADLCGSCAAYPECQF